MMEKLNKFSKKDVALMVLALVVIIWAIYFYLNNQGYLEKDLYQVSRIEGKLITGFPREFVFENDVVLKESSRTSSEGQNFWSASYISPKPAVEIFSLYKNALEFAGWEINNSSATTLFAKKGGMQISMVIEDKSNRREVTLSVLER